MYKVLLIDDEPIIRKGLKNIIKWHQYGCEVCGEAADGCEGLEKVEACHPDIIFTDIRMPEMDGLEMINSMVNSNQEVKIIILTGYRDFEYIKEALALGAFDYLLKPTKLDELKKVIHKAVAELDESKKHNQILDELRQQYEKGLLELQQKLLYDIMLGISTDKDEIKIREQELNIEIDEFYMVLIRSENITHYGMLETFKEMLSNDYETLNVALDHRSMAIIIKWYDGLSSQKIAKQCSDIQTQMNTNLAINVLFALSDKGKGIERVIKCYDQCKQIMDMRRCTEETDLKVQSSQIHKNMRLVMKKAIEYLENNYEKPITLQDVADAVYVSSYYISRMFKRETGKTMTEYLNEIRIKHACKLLDNIEYKIYQVGELVGIPDAHYFSRTFKKHIGVTPREYRETHHTQTN